MNATSKLTGRKAFLNMPQSYDFIDKNLQNIVEKGVIVHKIRSWIALSSCLSYIDLFLTSIGDRLAINSNEPKNSPTA